MARDKITVDLILATKQADREVARINKNIEKLGKTMGRSFGGTGGGGDKVRALGTGLSKATVKADEFSKSMEASNARVIAFGASAGLIMGVDRALKAMVASAVKVEKAMMDVNVVMGVSNRQLEQFGKGMFKVAKETAQSFDTVAEAATELARQGLGMEKTLSRTKDALILTRLTGMNAADAVKSLTAAVNSFNKEGVTSTQIVNRMAKVDAAFAVSSEDLAKSISRVGASAVSAGVNMNELMAITTAVQQRTARGGAVIGNAFKTIFTRIQRTSVQKKLKDFGIASRDMQGNMLGGIQVLQNMADGFDKLTKSQQASLAESVAGVFQVNILKSALSDLSSQTSNYTGALKSANSATNEAYQRNEQLNQTLDALANRTLANLTKAGAALGGATLEPAIRKILNSVNGVIDAFSEGGRFEDFGKTIGSGLLKGIGNFISGPGLLIATAAFAKISISLAKFAGKAFQDVMGINNATKQRVALEEAVIAHIAQEPALLAQVKAGTLNVLAVEKDILATIRLANLERARMQAYAAPVAGALVGRGVRVGAKGGALAPPGGAGGFIPNFASPGGERAAAAAGGYRAGSIRTMQQPGAGTMMYNSAETVKRFPGMSQSAIMPPQASPAGAGYKAAFGATHGFDPYAGRGFVPNFARVPAKTQPTFRRQEREGYAVGKRGNLVNMDLTLPAKHKDMGIIMESGSSTTPIRFSQNIMDPKGGITELASGMKAWRGNDGRKVGRAMLRLSGVPAVPIFPISRDNMNLAGGSNRTPTTPGKYLQKSLNKYSERLSKEMFGTTDVARDFDVEGLSRGTMGDIFEEGVRVAVGGAKNDDRLASFDYMGKKYANTRLMGFFNRQGRSANLKASKSKIEAKIGPEAAESGNIPRKMINDPMVGYSKQSVMKLFQNEFRKLTGSKGAHLKGTKTAAQGFVPNFFRFFHGRSGLTTGSLRSSQLQNMLPGIGPLRPSTMARMFQKKNIEGVISKKDAFMGSRTGQASSKMFKSLMKGTAMGLPISVWIAESIALYGKAAVTKAVKMLSNVAKGQKIGSGIAFADGFVPNFSPLSESIAREMQAGVPASAIRVGSSPALRGAGNPGGVGVYNTIHEPGGLGQGISMSRAGGIDPRTHGASGGFMPNFSSLRESFSDPKLVRETLRVSMLEKREVIRAEAAAAEKLRKAAGEQGDVAAKQARAANALMMAAIGVSMVGPSIGNVLSGGTPSGQAKGSGISNMLSMGMMGAATGAMMGGGVLSPVGAAIGGAVGLGVGALSMDWGMAFGEEGQKANAQQAKDAADAVAEGLEKVKKALLDLADVDFMKTEDKIKTYAALTERLNEVHSSLLAGGSETTGATEAFVRAKSKIGNVQDFVNMSPTDRKGFLKETDTLIKSAQDRARSTLTAGSQFAYEEGIMGFGGGMGSLWDSNSVAKKMEDIASTKRFLVQNPDLSPEKRLKWERKLQQQEIDFSTKTTDAFTPALQAKIAELPATRTRHSGKEELKRYQDLMEEGKGRQAMGVMASLLGRTEEGKMMAGSLRQALDQKDSFLGLRGNKLTDDDVMQMSGPGSTERIAQIGSRFFGGFAGDMDTRGAFGVMQMLRKGEKSGDLSMFFPDITDQQEKKLTAEEEKQRDRERASIRAFQTPIDEARAEGRRAGYDLIESKGDQRRERAGTAAARQNQKSLNAVKLFGDELINSTHMLELGKLEDEERLKSQEIRDTRDSKLKEAMAKSETKYLESIRDADMGEEQRTKARGEFDRIEKKLKDEGVDALKEERDTLQSLGKQRDTSEEKRLELLNSVINDEITIREKAGVSLDELSKDYGKNKEILDANTKSQKEILAATKQFYSGKHLDNLKSERSILEGKIKFQEEEVAAGRIHQSELTKSNSKMRDLNNQLGDTTNAFDDFYRKPMEDQRDLLIEQIKWQEIEVAARRLNITELEASKMSLEELKQKIDGTGDAFGTLLGQLDRVMGGLTDKEKEEATKGAIKELSALTRGRQAGEAGAQGLLGTGRAKDAFNQGLITGDEYRGMRRKARLGRGGDPMEAFTDQFMYGGRDAMLEMEDGVTNVAQTMKSSFADAFQSIASGANSVQGALANMAQSILNSISSMSANMFSNMLFSKWQGANGGLVPGYAGGGVVMGGSGYKDDVPTMMQGGEFVIKKSAAQKIGYGTLNSINGYAEGGPSMGQLGLVAAGASAASGLLAASQANKPDKPAPSQDYGFGRGKYGYFGGPDPDAGRVDSISGGGGRASVSLAKGFAYYRRDPATGRLISEKARPTEGRFEVSRGLSLLGRLGTDDPQTSRMFGKEEAMAKYQNYLATETKSRRDQIKAIERQKRSRLIGAYMNAAMLIGGAKWMGGGTGGDVAGQTAMSGIGAGMDTLTTPQGSVPRGLSSANLAPGNELDFDSLVGGVSNPWAGRPDDFGIKPGPALGGYMPNYANGGSASGTPAMVMGGEYIMSPETVRTYGTNFMHELNRGNVPSYANGGSVGGGGETLIGGNTTNNVRVNVNVDKSGKVEASAEGDKGSPEEGDRDEIENNKELGNLLQTVVVQELVKQQRPGGLLNRNTTGV